MSATRQEVYEDVYDDPNGNVTPDDPARPAFYRKQGSYSWYMWDTVLQAWVAIVTA